MKRYKLIMLVVIIITILGFSIFTAKLLGVWGNKYDSPANIENVLNHVKYLSSNEEFQPLQYRVAGMKGEKKAAKYIEEVFRKSGLEVKQQTFGFNEVIKENSNIVKFTCRNGKEIKTIISKTICNENLDETINGKLVDLGNGTKKDYKLKKDKIKGNFILIKIDKTTSIDYEACIELTKGVKGIIIYDPDFKAPSEPMITNKFVMSNNNTEDEKIVTVSVISKEDYDGLKKELKNKDEIHISEYVKYDVKREVRSSQNVIGVKNSDNKSTNKPLIIIGAHYDSINGPAANDNGSGTAALLELARILSSKKLNYDVKFVAFGAEESGLFGSKYFASTLTKDELKRCKLMINIEGSGIGDVFIIAKATGEEGNLSAQKVACDTAGKNNILYKRLEFSNSDQINFSEVGIPTITFASSEYAKGKKPIIKTKDADYHSFSELEKENVLIPKVDDTINDTYDLIEKSNKDNSNFKKLFKVLLEVLNSYN